MRLRPEVKVGLIVFLFLVALIVTYWFLGGIWYRTGTYQVRAIFDDVQRLSRGADVRMAGVRIGTVADISLTPTKRAEVRMVINRQYLGAIPEDSTARITTGGLIGVGEFYVEIIPGSSREAVRPQGYVQTTRVPRLDDLLVQFEDIVGGLRTSVASVNEMLQDPEMRASLKRTVESAEAATERTAALVRDVQDMVAANRPEVESILANASGAAADLAQVSQGVRSALDRGGIERIEQALASAGRAAENIEVASERLRELADDETLSAQVRETVASAREAARGAAEIVGRLRTVIGPREHEPAAAPAPIPGRGSRFDALALSETGDFRVDYNLTLPGRGGEFYRIGLFDLGESTKLNLQLGQMIDRWSAVRYGLYASRIGLGYDRRLDDDLALQLDLYRPNDPRLETKLRYDFSPDWGAWIGAEDLFGEGGALFGLQYRR